MQMSGTQWQRNIGHRDGVVTAKRASWEGEVNREGGWLLAWSDLVNPLRLQLAYDFPYVMPLCIILRPRIMACTSCLQLQAQPTAWN